MGIRVLENCDLLNQEEYSFPPRSRLYCLEPIGLSTGFVESLSSYSIRLAATHNVTHASLFGREIAPLIDRKYLRNSESKLDKNALLAASFGTLTRAVNGIGITARDYASALEKLTGREDLHFLTMLTWIEVIPHRNLLKPSKTWCPVCYEQWNLEQAPLYEPLLWSLSVVTACPQHHLWLRSRCQTCDRTLPTLDSHSRPGFCSKCKAWLGESPTRGLHISEEISSKEQAWQRWVVEQVSNLLAAAPRIEDPPQKTQLTESIRFCIKNIIRERESAFARALKVPQSTVNEWQKRGKTPELGRLLRIAFLARISLLDLLLGSISSYPSSKEGSHIIRNHWNTRKTSNSYKQRTRINITLVKNMLEEALSKELPQSIKTIAKDWGQHHSSLYKYFPDLCRQLAERYELYRRMCGEQRKEEFRKEIKNIVASFHKEGTYPSVKRVEGCLTKQKTLRYSKMALDTLREAREELGIASPPNNFARFRTHEN